MRVLVVTNLVPDEHGARSAAAGSATRSPRCAPRGVEVEDFGFPRGRCRLPAGDAPPARPPARASASTSSTPTTASPAGSRRLAGAAPAARHLPRHRRPPPASSARSRAGSPGAPTSSPRVSRALFAEENGRPGLPAVPGSAVLPCGPDLGRFAPDPARRRRAPRSASTPTAATSSSPPTRPGRRSATTAPPSSPPRLRRRAAHRRLDRARARCRLWINAANAVLVTSDYEGFGMAAIEALACDVPVLSTPVGVAPYAPGAASTGCLCAPFDADAWAAAARPHLDAQRPPRRRRRARAATLAAGAHGRAGDRGLPRT